ncbi:MAG: Ig domain-containing protein [Candidatus Gallimonas sp.]
MKKSFMTAAVSLVCAMACAFGLVACSESSGAETVAVESVTLDKTELTLEIGGEETLTATVTPENATEKTVIWSSDDTAVVTVENGKVTAVAAGSASVTATSGGKSATCQVTVNAPTPTTEVTAEEWARIMESADNFTYDNKMGTVKIVGATRSQSRGGQEQIFVKEGTEYYSYDNFEGSWKKSSITENVYNFSNSNAQMISYFKDDFASFSYADGKNKAASLDKTATLNSTLNNVEVTFENGALVGIKFSIGSGENSGIGEIKDVGTMTIILPSEFTDETATD